MTRRRRRRLAGGAFWAVAQGGGSAAFLFYGGSGYVFWLGFVVAPFVLVPYSIAFYFSDRAIRNAEGE